MSAAERPSDIDPVPAGKLLWEHWQEDAPVFTCYKRDPAHWQGLSPSPATVLFGQEILAKSV